MPLWDADVHIDASLTRQLLEDQFPELRPVSLEALGEGFDNVAWLVDERFVVRMPRRAIADRTFSHERDVLPLIAAQLPLPVPVPVLRGRPTPDYPYTFSGYRMLPGVTGCAAPLTEADRAAAAVPLAHFLRTLHDLPVEGALREAAPDDLIGRTDLPGRTQRILATLDQLEADAVEGPWPAVRAQLDTLSETPPWHGEPTLVHGDLYARHLIFDDKQQLAGVIDWGDVHVSDPALDLGIVWSFLPASAHARFFEHYGAIDGHTEARALYKALSYGVYLTAYGRDVGDADLLAVAQRCLALSRES